MYTTNILLYVILLYYYTIVVINSTHRMYTHIHVWVDEERTTTELLTFGAVPARCTTFGPVPSLRYLGGSGKTNQLALEEESQYNGGLKSEGNLPAPNTHIKKMIV